MTARPADYGNQFPSDVGDVPPQDPTTGFTERDYRPQRATAPRKTPETPSGSPDLRKERPRPEPRYAWVGTIVKRVDNDSFIILRQDGKRFQCYTRGNEDIYDELRIGDLVGLIPDQKPGFWLIVGGVRRKEMVSLTAINTFPVGPTDIPTLIGIDSFFSQTGQDAVGNNLNIALSDGGIQVYPEVSGQYEVSFSVTVEFLDPTEQSKLTVETKCFVFSTEAAPANAKPKTLAFDRTVGFKHVWDAVLCKSIITLNIAESDMMMDAPTGGNRARWSYNPRVGGDLTVGTKSAQGWLKITSNGPGSLWLGHGNLSSRIRFPNQTASWHKHLYVEALGGPGLGGGETVQLGWTLAGYTGPVYYSDCYDTCQILVFDKGILITNTALAGAPIPSTISLFQDSKQKDWMCVNP